MISGRMHFAIAALGRGVPCGCPAYTGKFEGLFGQFGLDPLILDVRDAAKPGAFEDFVVRVLRTRDEIRRQVAAALPGVMERAVRNL